MKYNGLIIAGSVVTFLAITGYIMSRSSDNNSIKPVSSAASTQIDDYRKNILKGIYDEKYGSDTQGGSRKRKHKHKNRKTKKH
jgi:hypothetical protein